MNDKTEDSRLNSFYSTNGVYNVNMMRWLTIIGMFGLAIEDISAICKTLIFVTVCNRIWYRGTVSFTILCKLCVFILSRIYCY